MHPDPATNPDDNIKAHPFFGPAFFVDGRELGYKQPVIIDIGNTGTRYRITVEQLGHDDAVLDTKSRVLELQGWPLYGQREDRWVASDYIGELISKLRILHVNASLYPILEASVQGGARLVNDPSYIPFHKDE